MKNKVLGETEITYERLCNVHRFLETLTDAVMGLAQMAEYELAESTPDSESNAYLADRYVKLDSALECLIKGSNYIKEEMKNYE